MPHLERKQVAESLRKEDKQIKVPFETMNLISHLVHVLMRQYVFPLCVGLAPAELLWCSIAIRSFNFLLGCLLMLTAHSLRGFSVSGFIVWQFWNGCFSELLVQYKTAEELNRGGKQARRASVPPRPILQNIKHTKSLFSLGVFLCCIYNTHINILLRVGFVFGYRAWKHRLHICIWQ